MTTDISKQYTKYVVVLFTSVTPIFYGYVFTLDLNMVLIMDIFGNRWIRADSQRASSPHPLSHQVEDNHHGKTGVCGGDMGLYSHCSVLN